MTIELLEKLKRIRAKIVLGLPLNTYEGALWTLYGHLLGWAL